MIIGVMGVSGSGKSTVGKLLAQRLSNSFIEADDFHSTENISKMSKGVPLTDADRKPWLAAVSAQVKLYENNGVVLACSALKEAYRIRLQQGLHEKILWTYMEGSEKMLLERLKNRTGHFMPVKLLQSQLEILEMPLNAYRFSIEKAPEQIVEEILQTINF